jgi:hypothetical protein
LIATLLRRINMTELKKPSAEIIELMNEFHRQLITGEYAAWYWCWAFKDNSGYWVPVPYPIFENLKIRYHPSETHPHYAVYKEWEALKASGDVDREEVELLREMDSGTPKWTRAPKPQWYVDSAYKIHKTSKHPDNCKPKLKLIDWSSVPVGTLTNFGVVVVRSEQKLYTVATNGRCLPVNYDSTQQHRLLPATKWTALEDDQEPPVVEGLVIEYRYHNRAMDSSAVSRHSAMPRINAYRVISLAEGYTDDPAKVGGV